MSSALAARAKFSRAMQMLFTRAGYEQSSSEPIARYRAARFGGARRVADLCCGIGGDLLALARRAREALAVDRDDVHARLALHNAAVYGQAGNVRAVVADVRDIRLDGFDAVFIDPARRSGPGTASAPAAPARAGSASSAGGRCLTGGASAGAAHRFRAGQSEPPLDWCFALADRVPAVCVKAAPGLPTEPDPGRLGGGVHRRRPRPQGGRPLVTGPGDRAGGCPGGPRRARCWPAGRTPSSRCPGDPVPVTEPGEYLLDPNPAVTRAGLVEDLARSLADDDGARPGGGDGDVARSTRRSPSSR